MLEVEQKFKVDDRQALSERLVDLGATANVPEHHADTYYRHPCRDFVQTGEAFRIRKIDDVAAITYKGPKLKSTDATLKARKEIEWSLAPNDADGSQIVDLLDCLGFTPVATVKKTRETFGWAKPEIVNENVPLNSLQSFSVTIDQVEEVGLFAEIELLVAGKDGISEAEHRIRELAQQLNLATPVRASYLEMLLDGR